MPEKQQRGGGTWSSQVAARPWWPGRRGPCGHTEGPGPRPRRPRPAPSWPPRGPRSSGKSRAVSPGRGPHLGLRGALAQGPCHGAVPSVPDGERPPGARLPALCQPVRHGRHGEAGCGLLAPPGSAGRPAGRRALRPWLSWLAPATGRAPPPCSDPPPCGRLKPTSRWNRNEAARLTELTPAPLRGRPRPSAQHRSAARTPPAGWAGLPRGIPVLGLLSIFTPFAPNTDEPLRQGFWQDEEQKPCSPGKHFLSLSSTSYPEDQGSQEGFPRRNRGFRRVTGTENRRGF